MRRLARIRRPCWAPCRTRSEHRAFDRDRRLRRLPIRRRRPEHADHRIQQLPVEPRRVGGRGHRGRTAGDRSPNRVRGRADSPGRHGAGHRRLLASMSGALLRRRRPPRPRSCSRPATPIRSPSSPLPTRCRLQRFTADKQVLTERICRFRRRGDLVQRRRDQGVSLFDSVRAEHPRQHDRAHRR